MNGIGRLAPVGFALVVICSGAGCSVDRSSTEQATPPPRVPASTQPSVAYSRPTFLEGRNATLDVFRSSDLAFFERLTPRGAIVAKPQASLRVLSSESSVTVVASVVDVRASAVAASTPILEIVLRPERIIKGQLQAASDVIRVPALGFGDGTAQEQVTALRTSLPQGQSVWFLRWQGNVGLPTKPNAPTFQVPSEPDLYALTHAYGVLVQGATHVVAPLADADVARLGFVGEAELLATISDALAAAN